MGGQGCAAGLAEAGEDVDDAGGEAGLLNELGEAEAGEGCLLGELEDDGAAGGEGGAELQAAMRRGKFQGMIWATTPMGSRTV